MVKSIKTFDAQQLICEAALDNFASSTQPDNYINKLIFPLKWRSKLAKQRAKILSVDQLQQKFKPEGKLNISFLTKWVNDLVPLFINVIETTSIELLI